jgi:DNA-binding beta-propeller fold protein YncE
MYVYLQIKSIHSFYRISFHLSFQIKTFLSSLNIFRKNKIFFFSHLFKSISSSFSSLEQQLFIPNLTINQTWKQHGTTIAGGHGEGNGLNQLSRPRGVFIDDDQTIYIADYGNDRIVEWKSDASTGQIVAGGNGQGNRNDQLNKPSKVIVDKENDSLIICDRYNQRVVRWPRRNGRSGETLISNIACWELIMDNDGYLYVSDWEKHEVRRWKMGEKNGIIVAGGNGQGNRLDQLNYPGYIFIDQDHSVYVSDENNHRVMKWVKDAKEGIIVAGGQGKGNGLRQFSCPHGIIVDQLGSIYVADFGNDRVIRWLKGAEEGTVVVGGNGEGEQLNQFSSPRYLSFDRQNNLYVVDLRNHRVQKFDVNLN